MTSCTDEELAGELELLAAMCSDDELKIEATGTGTRLAVKLAPMTAGDQEKQFLWCELQIHVGHSYPSEPPSLALGGSRGLSDISRASLLTELGHHVEELCGEPALFALLEAGRAALTALNSPQGECSICLGSLCDAGSEHVLRTPCYHVFHRQCLIEYCRAEITRDHLRTQQPDALSLSLPCPECRADIPWTAYPELQKLLPQAVATVAESPESSPKGELSNDEVPCHQVEELNCIEQQKHAQNNKQLAKDAEGSISSRHEAFIRLHHLYQGNDEKEKPLLRLLKELGLDAVVYYGKPALLHIQGDPKDVDSFAGTAKRRRITITIDMAQRSQGPPITSGITSVAAKKGSLNSAILAEHLERRGLGETSFTIIG